MQVSRAHNVLLKQLAMARDISIKLLKKQFMLYGAALASHIGYYGGINVARLQGCHGSRSLHLADVHIDIGVVVDEVR